MSDVDDTEQPRPDHGPEAGRRPQTRKRRKQQILEAFATMLETDPGSRITTAALAREVGVSEAALYRHFPSKAKMFEGLIEFIEENLFTRLARLTASTNNEPLRQRCGHVLQLLVVFAERNPGMTRLLTGDALAGEQARLRARVRQIFDRIETELRTALRDGELRGEVRLRLDPALAVDLLVSAVQGKLMTFVRSDFTRLPTSGWQDQWAVLENAVFAPTTNT